jgi:RNA polymerase sigma factor (sigma-70 family)
VASSKVSALAHRTAERSDVAVARGRDEAALTLMVDLEARNGQALWGFARRLGLTEDEAQDVVQETLLRLWRELGRGAAIEDAVGWAFRTTYRAAMDQHRAARRLSLLRDRLRRDRPREPRGDAADRLAVWTEVSGLPERQRHVLYLRYRADRSFEQIAEILGMSNATARSHCSQALRTLRRRLAEDAT